MAAGSLWSLWSLQPPGVGGDWAGLRARREVGFASRTRRSEDGGAEHPSEGSDGDCRVIQGGTDGRPRHELGQGGQPRAAPDFLSTSAGYPSRVQLRVFEKSLREQLLVSVVTANHLTPWQVLRGDTE